MSRLLRIVLLCLIALALPVQGLAAATMLHCGPAHHGLGGAASVRGAHVHADASRHVHAPGHHHADEGDEAASSAAATTPDSADPVAGKTVTDLHKFSKSKCASCASCCSATALPSTSIALESPLLAESRDAARPVSAAVFLTGGTERPPRFFLA